MGKRKKVSCIPKKARIYVRNWKGMTIQKMKKLDKLRKLGYLKQFYI